MKKTKNKQSGQVMLITVLVLSGIMIAASTIAGYLMLLKIRQSSEMTSSARAIFAADAGIEWDLYRRVKDANYPPPIFNNGPGVSVRVTAGPTYTKSIGSDGNISRAFDMTFEALYPSSP